MVPVDDLAAVGISSIAHGIRSNWFFVRYLVLWPRAGAWSTHVQCLLALWDMAASAYGWEQVNNERQNIERKYQRDDYQNVNTCCSRWIKGICRRTPFENCSGVRCAPVPLVQDSKANRKTELNDDKQELDPEAHEKDAVLSAICDTQSQILQTDEYSANQVGSTIRFVRTMSLAIDDYKM